MWAGVVASVWEMQCTMISVITEVDRTDLEAGIRMIIIRCAKLRKRFHTHALFLFLENVKECCSVHIQRFVRYITWGVGEPTCGL